jgi:hypothetical protein
MYITHNTPSTSTHGNERVFLCAFIIAPFSLATTMSLVIKSWNQIKEIPDFADVAGPLLFQKYVPLIPCTPTRILKL